MNTRNRWIGAALIVLILATVFIWEGWDQPSAPQTELAAGTEPAGQGAADGAKGGSQTDSGSPTAPGQTDESAGGGMNAEASGDPSGEPGSDAEAANKAGATDGTSAGNTEEGAEGAGTSGGTADTSSPDGATGTPSGDGSDAAAPSTSGTAGAASAGSPSTGSSGNSPDSGSAPSSTGKASSGGSSSASPGKSPSTSSSTAPSTVPGESGSGTKQPAKDSTSAQQPAKSDSSQPPAKGESPAAGGKDKYQTEPVPDGKAQPVEWQDAEVDKTKTLTATLSVSATTLLDKLDKLDSSKLEVLPEDGIIYKARKVTFYEGESVFDVLLREMKKSKIHMEFEMTPLYNSNYIEGINNLYEFDAGELSGWMYKVNGWFPNYGSSRYALEDGDVIEWVYTTDLGRDVGGDSSAGGRS
ncbi:hypothetical protein PA598K_02702 [Paenibacillus sp. 598K]|uniref:DUF4430 domain-containing protein n=1 Tax=Paenibacillus sp. 598K TaxID=1117987 RepID=UPI000FFA4845|nr:DUF4430 domain-containing protein [Paenibacillus sp. 598K]GBF74363.1 hypothetical protein PA598K_02702 [Paenibacillus sp. 598K]